MALLNAEPDLLQIWKEVQYLKSTKGDAIFLKAIKKVIDDNVWKHILGEVHSPTFSNGGHFLGPVTLETDAAGVQWVTGSKIRFKPSDVRLPNPYDFATHGNTVQKAVKIEISNGSTWVAKTGGGTSSFFPSTWSKERIIEETALAFKKAKKNPSSYKGGNTYEVLATDNSTNIRFFYGVQTELNPLINGSTNPKIITSFPAN
jgi:hypothetical protein